MLLSFWNPLLLLFPIPTLASPIAVRNTLSDTSVLVHSPKTLAPRAWTWKLTDLTAEFKGIYWEHAFTDCTPDQLDKIIFTTRAAQWMLQGVEDDAMFSYSAAWDRYFGAYPIWYKSGATVLSLAAQIQHNILQVIRYPKKGHQTKDASSWKAHYSCKPAGQEYAQRRCDRGATALTIKPDQSTYGAWTIVFCAKFFEEGRLRYLEERTNGQKKSPADIAMLDTYERILIHEYMHVDMMKFKPGHIDDIKGQLYDHGPVVDIYGESRCREFAHKWITRTGGQPNTKVVTNADSYAWFFLYHWFDKKWSWHTTPHDELRKAQSLDEQYEIDPRIAPATPDPDIGVQLDGEFVDEKDVPISYEVPESCTIDVINLDPYGSPRITCEYLGGDDEAWKTPFASEGGCELSPKCRTTFGENAVEPKCECTCDGEVTPLRDERCAGFAGALPGRKRPLRPFL